MSAEAERVFSSTGQQLLDRRRKLGDNIVEVQEFLKSLMRSGLLYFERAGTVLRMSEAAASSDKRRSGAIQVEVE
ncbi:hypothetical protein BDD12DRAFT_896542 [Trichophaea hybrida]|nr:hypothetical protein BDD12DRAFT_896542 [Trichophaea hybrida]